MNHLPRPIQVDFRSDEPIYIQITEQIRHMVASGVLKQGDQLPTVRQLATELRINFNTVARSYRLLDEAGLISTQHGRGTFIWEQPSDITSNETRQENLDELTHRYISEAKLLNATPEEVELVVKQHLTNWSKNQTGIEK